MKWLADNWKGLIVVTLIGLFALYCFIGDVLFDYAGRGVKKLEHFWDKSDSVTQGMQHRAKKLKDRELKELRRK